ncbi:hypothetical protein VTK73DRAFT_1705 [Phialemonium thermophilum]|uniref:DNA damage-binding protein 1 n=1 Tax=Phialemonium thermophilum TaxID=223376 RepID=A0ABR3X8P5_9PEZI
MAYIAPIHRPSSVRHALQIKLLSADQEDLVLAKANRLEIWRLEDGLLSLAHSKVVHGTISMLQRLQPKDSPTDLLFVGTDRFTFFTVAWNPETHRLETTQTLEDVGERHMRDSQSLDRCLVDPSGKYLAMHLWEGVLTVMRLRKRKGTNLTLDFMGQVRLTELFIRASTFLYTETGHPKIAFLYLSDPEALSSKLATYRLTSDDKDTVPSRFDAVRDRELSRDVDDPNASLLIPVKTIEEAQKRHNVRNPSYAKAHLGGFIVVGETKVLYLDEVTKETVEASLDEPCLFVAWAEYDTTHYFLSDDFGGLHLLELVCDGDIVTDMDVHRLGKTSRPSSLLYLGNNLLFVGSHHGDSQLWQVDLSPEADGHLQLIQRLSNIGPILDFAVMDMGNREGDSQVGNEYSSGQARIVTGSGAHDDGSLRSVRSGVGLEDMGVLAELDNVRGLFSLRSHGSSKADTLAVSLLVETRIFRFESPGEVEGNVEEEESVVVVEVPEFNGFDLNNETLLAANLASGRFLQVTPAAATLIDVESGVTVSKWEVPEEQRILNASANDKWLLLSVDGATLVSLDLEGDLRMACQKSFSERDQIACVHVAPGLRDVGVVGSWSSNVSLFDLASLQAIHGETLKRTEDQAAIPRHVALVQMLPPEVSGPTLFVAMGDGNVVSYSVSLPDLSLSGRKSVVLGTREAGFHLLPRLNGCYSIFATSEHPCLIYESEGRIVYSGVTAEDATCVCPFDTEPYPDCIALVSKESVEKVHIARIDATRRTHVKDLPMGKTVRRIAYSPSEKVLGLGCIKRELDEHLNEERAKSTFELVDDVVLGKVGKPFWLQDDGLGMELVESVIRAELPDAHGNLAERFIVGTSFVVDPDSAESTDIRGRILVFGIDQTRSPYLIQSVEKKGACRCLAMMGEDKIVAGLTKTVVVYQYVETSNTSASLLKRASYRPSTYPVDIAVHGDLIAVADLMKSVSVVKFDPGTDEKPPSMSEWARHYQSAWTTAVAHLEEESWLAADAQGNLLVLRRNADAVLEHEQRRLEITSEMNLGEMVNRIRKITVETSPNAIIIPTAFLATVEGAIYMFGTIAASWQDLLIRFQARLADAVETAGNIPFRSYRAFRNQEREGDGPYRFVDGELLERFLDLDEGTQKDVSQGLGPSVEDLRNMVEELKRMH